MSGIFTSIAQTSIKTIKLIPIVGVLASFIASCRRDETEWANLEELQEFFNHHSYLNNHDYRQCVSDVNRVAPIFPFNRIDCPIYVYETSLDGVISFYKERFPVITLIFAAALLLPKLFKSTYAFYSIFREATVRWRVGYLVIFVGIFFWEQFTHNQIFVHGFQQVETLFYHNIVDATIHHAESMFADLRPEYRAALNQEVAQFEYYVIPPLEIIDHYLLLPIAMAVTILAFLYTVIASFRFQQDHNPRIRRKNEELLVFFVMFLAICSSYLASNVYNGGKSFKLTRKVFALPWSGYYHWAGRRGSAIRVYIEFYKFLLPFGTSILSAIGLLQLVFLLGKYLASKLFPSQQFYANVFLRKHLSKLLPPQLSYDNISPVVSQVPELAQYRFSPRPSPTPSSSPVNSKSESDSDEEVPHNSTGTPGLRVTSKHTLFSWHNTQHIRATYDTDEHSDHTLQDVYIPITGGPMGYLHNLFDPLSVYIQPVLSLLWSIALSVVEFSVSAARDTFICGMIIARWVYKLPSVQDGIEESQILMESTWDKIRISTICFLSSAEPVLAIASGWIIFAVTRSCRVLGITFMTIFASIVFIILELVDASPMLFAAARQKVGDNEAAWVKQVAAGCVIVSGKIVVAVVCAGHALGLAVITVIASVVFIILEFSEASPRLVRTGGRRVYHLFWTAPVSWWESVTTRARNVPNTKDPQPEEPIGFFAITQPAPLRRWQQPYTPPRLQYQNGKIVPPRHPNSKEGRAYRIHQARGGGDTMYSYM
ncbi:hypothetical protein EX30DRAFT_364851 [Ascodesmis nigricans]|uniref:Uncharacterized protein n=1 Tax=Ascodesmis nigricans TaxID=341454 RepID=A0A4S2MU43_9PEZI|nr:hypothetical protein EX30DRAFT_364851 [Ascodesmis nigricans]